MARADDVRAIVTGARTRGLSDDQIRALVARYDERQQTATPAAAPEQPAGGIAKTIADAMPSVGGAIGGTVGGVGGAALGGAAGSGYRQLIAHASEIPGAVADVARNLVSQPGATLRGAAQGAAEGAVDSGVSGAVQGAMEGAGKYIVQPIAKGLYGLALRPTKALRDKYGLGQLIEAGMANHVMPTAGGAAKAGGLVAKSRAAQEGMASAFDAAGGAPLSVDTAIQRGLKPLQAEAQNIERATGANASGSMRKQIDAVRRTHGQVAHEPADFAAGKINPTSRVVGAPKMSAVEMMAAKRAADDVADPAYLAAAKGATPVLPGSEAATAKGFSKGYRETLNDAVGPQFAQQGRTTKTLYGLKRAADRIGGEQHVLTNVAAGSVGAGTAALNGGDVGQGIKNALIFRGLMSPGVQAAGAFALQPAFRYGARAADAASGAAAEDALKQAILAQLLGGEQP